METQNNKNTELEEKIKQLETKVQELQNVINDMKEDLEFAVYYANEYYNKHH